MSTEDHVEHVSDESTPSDDTPEDRERDAASEEEHAVDWAKASLVSVLGIELAGFLLVGVLGGNYLDDRLGTSPLFMLLGVFVGLAAAGLQLWRFVAQAGGPRDDDD